MSRFGVVLAAALAAGGCGAPLLPPGTTPSRTSADLEAAYEQVDAGHRDADIAAYFGKPGAALAGYLTTSLRRKPESGPGNVAAGESDKYWASADGAGALRVIFGADGRARLVELVRSEPMGPPPGAGLPVTPPSP